MNEGHSWFGPGLHSESSIPLDELIDSGAVAAESGADDLRDDGFARLYRAFLGARAALGLVLVSTTLLAGLLGSPSGGHWTTLLCVTYALQALSMWLMPQLQRGATIAIPADAAGTARALVLLQNFTLLTFSDRAGLHATLADITGNRLHLNIRQVPRSQLSAALEQVAFAVIDSADAAKAGLYPARDSIGIEDARSPWQNVLAVRAGDRNEPWVAPLLAAYHSEPVAKFILERYQDSVRRPW